MSFDLPPFRFTLDDGYACLDLGEALCELCVEDLQEQLQSSGRLPDLGGAPVASWLLARLQYLSEDTDLTPSNEVEYIDDGVWVLDFVVGQGGVPVAKVQLQAGMTGAAILGAAIDKAQADFLLACIVEGLLVEPLAVAECLVEIHDPLWRSDPEAYLPRPDEGAVARFGFDGDTYLGHGNIQAKA